MRISEALDRHSRVRYNLTNSDDKEGGERRPPTGI